jgi:hypothetical protein
MMVAVSGYTPVIINSIDPAEISVYPNYLWVYMHHHITGNVIQILVLIIYFSKHQQLRNNLKQTSQDVFDFAKRILSVSRN